MLRSVVRAVYRRLVPSRAKETLHLWVMFDEPDRPPQAIERFDERNVLVLAPHMDDEVIGCGGVVRRHVLAGGDVTVVFMTDGRHGDPELYERGLDAAAIAEAEDRLVAERKVESERAAGILGVESLLFLDGRDGELDVRDDLVERLAGILNVAPPDVIYLPSVFDAHADHWATNRILHRSLESVALDGVTIRGYEVWTPLLVNRIADIGDVVEAKREALEQFVTQTRHFDLVSASLGLAQYRAIHAGTRRGYAEAFHESSLAAYRLLMERFGAKR